MLLWKYFCCLVCLTSSPHLSLGHYNVHSWHLKRQLLIVYQVQPLFISMFLWWNSSERWGEKRKKTTLVKSLPVFQMISIVCLSLSMAFWLQGTFTHWLSTSFCKAPWVLTIFLHFYMKWMGVVRKDFECIVYFFAVTKFGNWKI